VDRFITGYSSALFPASADQFYQAGVSPTNCDEINRPIRIALSLHVPHAKENRPDLDSGNTIMKSPLIFLHILSIFSHDGFLPVIRGAYTGHHK
jgi:hypothetical protein